MTSYFLTVTASLFEEMFTNQILEIVPILFLFVIGLTLLNLLKNVA